MSENSYAESGARDRDIKLVDGFVEQLGEHFDCVQIFVSRHMPAELNGTITCNRGSGHWCARYGQIREWLIYEDERIRQAARKNNPTNEP